MAPSRTHSNNRRTTDEIIQLGRIEPRRFQPHVFGFFQMVYNTNNGTNGELVFYQCTNLRTTTVEEQPGQSELLAPAHFFLSLSGVEIWSFQWLALARFPYLSQRILIEGRVGM